MDQRLADLGNEQCRATWPRGFLNIGLYSAPDARRCCPVAVDSGLAPAQVIALLVDVIDPNRCQIALAETQIDSHPDHSPAAGIGLIVKLLELFQRG